MKYCLALMVTIVSGFSFGQYRNDDASGALEEARRARAEIQEISLK
jgi:hypothetical protein